jgi:tripartite-type tricarboxylate transporter receptor subunit TctC
MRLFFVSLISVIAIPPAAAQPVTDPAQTFPSRAIRIVVPFPPGGPTDINARIIAQRMSEDWKQPVVIENRPGANTSIGAQMVAKADPDGYTLLAAMDTTLVMHPAAAGAPLTYDPFKDFATVTLRAKNPLLFTVRAADGPESVKELIARAKAAPGKLNYGAGIITTRLAGYLFAKSAGIEVQLIPYKGSADVVQGLLSGSVDFIVDGVAASLPLIQSGRLRALAKLNRRPLPVLPNLHRSRSRWVAGARGHVVVDRVCGAGRNTPAVGRQDRARDRGDLCRSGHRRPAGAGRHHRRDHDAARVRRLFSRRGRALDEGFSRERHQAGLTVARMEP